MLDFSHSDRYLPQWIIKREIVFDQLEGDNLVEIKRLRQGLHASAAAAGDGETYKHHFDSSVSEIKGIGELLFPWIDWQSDPKAAQYQKMWEEWYGVKVGSPEWKELERQGEMLQELYKQGRSGRGKKLINA